MEHLKENWDVIVVGGGITGAGVFREAVRMGLSALLAEQRDFAWGTSSRSSKLVHGGLRYLREGRIRLTRDAVREREHLLGEAPGLVEPLEFLVPLYKDRGPKKWVLEAGLSVYDLMAKKRQHQYCHAGELASLEPHLNRNGLQGGFRFRDAQVDDARLVLRLIFEAEAAGGCALNYTAVKTIIRNEKGHVAGVTLEDAETGQSRSVSAGVVFNATGCWAERLHPSPDPRRHLRPLRGSHLIFPRRVLPVRHAVSFVHPVDERAVFLIPWEGAVVVGTTDLDHEEDLSCEPAITRGEADYLMEGLRGLFPSLEISETDCISTLSGVRPVLSEGKLAPSEESREHAVWKDRGLVTVTGGKLTTFRVLAVDAINAAREFMPDVAIDRRREPVFSDTRPPQENAFGLVPETCRRLWGRYGSCATHLIQSAAVECLQPVPGTFTLWAELPYAAGHEKIRHLDDLLLRRVRIGLLVPEGAREHLPRIQKLCDPALPWDRKTWKREVDRYNDIWARSYSWPGVKRDKGPLETVSGRFRALLSRWFH